jgi:G3E family GTPase
MLIPVLITTGFLGCGKTSFLRHLLPLCGPAARRPLLIINEVGDTDVDGTLLADLHAEQARLVGGCVCCTLQSQLAQTLLDALERRAHDLIIIECSGLSNPLDVIGVLSMPALLTRVAVSHVLCVLDAARAAKVLAVAELAKIQVSTADIVILNKIDHLPDAGRPAVEALCATLAPHATRYWATYGALDDAVLFALLTDPAPAHTPCACGDAHQHAHAHHTHSLPASFCTFALPLPNRVTLAALERLLRRLPENIVRIKGFAHLGESGWHVLHRAFDCVDIAPLTGTIPSTGPLLVCIGQHLEPAAILASVTATLGEVIVEG